MSRSNYRFKKVTRYLMSLPSASYSTMASRVGSETPTSSAWSTSEGGASHELRSVPIFLPVGAAVSAKYRGAFCEALIERVTLNYRLRVRLKDKKACVTVDRSNVLSGNVELNAEVSVLIKSGEFSSNDPQTASIVRITDLSLYTVVFDDGDKRSLKRTQLVLKGERHFKESESLDRLPLTNPEQFKQPVIDRTRRYQSSLEDDDDEGDEVHGRVALKETIKDEDDEDEIEEEEEEEEESTTLAEITLLADEVVEAVAPATTGQKVKKMPSGGRKSRTTSSAAVTTVTDVDDATTDAASGGGRNVDDNYHRLLGSLVMIDMPISWKNDSSLLSTSAGDASTSATPSRRRYTPGLVVLPSAMPSIDLKAVHAAPKDTVFLVRSFRENRFYAVPQSYLEPLSRAKAVKLAHHSPNLRTAFERAILWLDRRELPSSWGSDLEVLFGYNWRSGANSGEDITKPSKSRHHSSSTFPKKSRRRRLHRSPSLSSIDAFSYSTSPDSSSVSLGASSSDGDDAGRSFKKKAHQSKPIKRRRNAPSASESSTVSSGTNAYDNSYDEAGPDGDRDSDASTSSESPEYFEERDRWIAKLYRFMDARGTPINKAPSIANKDLDLFKLYRKVDRLGGFHRVTSQLKWAAVYSEMDLPHNFAAGPRSLQTAFKKYLFPIDDLSRKLGTSLDEIPIPLPRKSKAAASTAAAVAAVEPFMTSNKTTPPGVAQTAKATAKADETKREVGQRRTSTAKDEKPSRNSDPKARLSTATPIGVSTPKPPSSSVTSKKTSPSADAMPLQRKDKRTLASATSALSSVADTDASRERIPGKPVTPEASHPLPPPPAASKKTTATSKHRLTSGGDGGEVFEEPQSASSSPVLPTFETEALVGVDDGSPQSPIPLGTMVRVRHKGHSYKAKVVQHIYDPVRPASMTEGKEVYLMTTETPTGERGELRYRIHYAGWNARHDEIIGRERITLLIGCLKRSPSCSTLNLLGRTSSVSPEDKETVSDSGGMQQRQRRPQNQRFKPPKQQQQQQQKGRQSVKRLPASPNTCDSDSAAPSVSVKKLPRTASVVEEAKNVSVSSTKRASSGPTADTQPAKKRRFQTEAKVPRAEAEPTRIDDLVPTKSTPKLVMTMANIIPPTTSSIVDAATSLAQSPNLLKKVMCRDPIDLKSLPSVMATTMKPSPSSSKFGLEDISSDEDAFPPQQHSTPVRCPVTSRSNTPETPQHALSSTLTPLPLAPPSPALKRIKLEPVSVKVATNSCAIASLSKPSKVSTSPISSVKAPSIKTMNAAARRPIVTKKPIKPKLEEEKGARDREKKNKEEKEKEVKAVPTPSPSSSFHSSEAGGSVSSQSPSPTTAVAPTVAAVASTPSSEDEGDLLATSDVLPRLTRSQHRLILGNTPPGAQLLTATANPPAVLKKEEEVVEVAEEKEAEKGDKEAISPISTKKSEKGKKTGPAPNKKSEVVSGKATPKKVEKGTVISALPPKASASPPAPDPTVSVPSPHPPSPSVSVISDVTEPMRLSPPSYMIIPKSQLIIPKPDPIPVSANASASSSSTPARCSSSEASALEEEEGEVEEQSEDEAEEVEDEEEEELKDTEMAKSLLRPSGECTKPQRGVLGRGSGGRSRHKRVSATVSATAPNDDAESVISSASSGFRSVRKGIRGRRGASNTAVSTAATTPRGSSPTFSSPIAEGGITANVSTANTPTTPTVRRFGGPYYPILNLDSLPSGAKCLVLQHRLMQIIGAWRSAKQMLKAVDQRSAALTATLSTSLPGSPGTGGSGTVGRGGVGVGCGSKRGGGGSGGGGLRGGLRRRQLSVNLVDESHVSPVPQ